MTLQEAISRTDELKPNSYTEKEKILWLSKLDWMLVRNVIRTHDGDQMDDFSGYNESTDLSTELIAPEPYDTMYIKWLEAQIDLANAEYNRYNASISLFTADYNAYGAFYTASNMPKSHGPFVF